MSIITAADLEGVLGGMGPSNPTGITAQDIMNAKPADNRVLSQPNNGGFQTNTPMVSSPNSNANIPDSVFSTMGM
jgi:hypothetical protein